VKRRVDIESKIATGHTDKDDPRDVEAIEHLEHNFGYWKLKSSSNYSVPVEKQAVDTKSKLLDLITCEDSMHEIKTVFNKEVSALKSERSKLAKAIETRNNRIVEISEILQEPRDKASLWSPSDDEDRCDPQRNNPEGPLNLLQQGTSIEILPKILSRHQPPGGQNNSSPRSAVEREERYEQEVLLRHEMSEILSNVLKESQEFDQTLHQLIIRRMELGIKLKRGEYCQTLMLEELKVLASVEKEGIKLVSKRSLCNAKKREVSIMLVSDTIYLRLAVIRCILTLSNLNVPS